MNVASTPAMVLALVASGLLACTEPDAPKDTEAIGSTGSTGASTGLATDSTGKTASEPPTSTTGASTGDAPPAFECGQAGGVCIAKGGCAEGGGEVAAASPGGCDFDEGPGECCVPKASKPNPKTCEDAGGLCAPIGGCLDAGGYFTSFDKGCEFSGTFACCVPHERCGEQTIDCCTDGATFNPSCDSGEFVCLTGEAKPKDSCESPR